MPVMPFPAAVSNVRPTWVPKLNPSKDIVQLPVAVRAIVIAIRIAKEPVGKGSEVDTHSRVVANDPPIIGRCRKLSNIRHIRDNHAGMDGIGGTEECDQKNKETRPMDR